MSVEDNKEIENIVKLRSNHHDIFKNLAIGENIGTFAQGFSVLQSQKIEQLSHTFATAYEVKKPEGVEGEYYAIILNEIYLVPFDSINKLVNENITGIVRPIAASLVQLEEGGEKLLGFILPKINAHTLENIISEINVHENSEFFHSIIEQINIILKSLHSAGIAYGRLNPGNIYIDNEDKVILSEIVSQPIGFAQRQAYETPVRAQCSLFGKAVPKPQDDYYALGCTICDMFSRLQLGTLDDQLLEYKIEFGTYRALTTLQNVYERYDGLVQGLLVDREEERWGYGEVNSFLENKQYTIPSSKGLSLNKMIIFQEREYSSLSLLASDLCKNWDEARNFISSERFKRWLNSVDLQYNLLDLWYKVEYTSRYKVKFSGGNMTREDIDLTKMLIVLDPNGLIRYKDFTFQVEAIAPLLMHFINTENKGDAKALIEILLSDMDVVFQRLLQEHATYPHKHYSESIKKIRDTILTKDIGFGIERCLYDLLPMHPAMSSILPVQNCFDIKQAIIALDEREDLQIDDILNDKHLTAFMASKLKLSTPLAFKEQSTSTLLKSQDIKILLLLTLVQEEARIQQLNNLVQKLADRVKNMINNNIHGETNKKEALRQIDEIIQTGKLSNLTRFINHCRILHKDQSQYQEIQKYYYSIIKKRNYYSNLRKLENIEYNKGIKAAVNTSYILCYIVALLSLIKYI